MVHNESSHSMDEEEYEDDKVIETSPDGRFVCFEHKLGAGAFKTVFRAMDTDYGIEMAWNQVLIDRYQLDKATVLREIQFFKQIRHQNIIEFYHFWVDEAKNQVVFLTELMPSGTLTQYIKKSPEVKLKIIKGWCKQILLGLDYLHTQTPPIIHRDIKCGNIFINGTGTTEGEVKIGDLGLATFCQKKDALSVIGTPEFMAPEYYNEVYTTAVDIWAFGMAVIEMVTRQYPYQECDNVGQIFKKVSGGILPQQLDLILDKEVKNFVALCLRDESIRPTASQLLSHSFFSAYENDNSPVKIARSLDEVEHLQVSQDSRSIISDSPLPNRLPSIGKALKAIPTDGLMSGSVHSDPTSTTHPTLEEPNFSITHVEKIEDKLEITFSMEAAGDQSEIVFEYNIGQDTPESVASEMVNEMQLEDSSYDRIFQSLKDVEQDYVAKKRDTPRASVESMEENEVSEATTLSSSVESAQSEPIQRSRKEEHSLSFLSEPTDSASSVDIDQDYTRVTNLEQLIDGIPSPRFTLPPTSDVNDMKYLEDLLDGDDISDADGDPDESMETASEQHSDDLSYSVEEPSEIPLTPSPEPGSPSQDLTSEEEDEQAILALKEKHEIAMQALLKSQEDEIRKVTERRIQRRHAEDGNLSRTNSTPRMSHSAISRTVKLDRFGSASEQSSPSHSSVT